MMLPDFKSIGVAVVCSIVAAGAGYVYARAGVEAEKKAAVEQALTQARLDTDNAIIELASEADRARLLRRVCLDDPRGMSWDFAHNQCVEAKAQP